MIETMVEFRPDGALPRRRLLTSSALQHSQWLLQELIDRHLIQAPVDSRSFIEEVIREGHASL